MKNLLRLIGLVGLLVVLALPGAVLAQDDQPQDKIVFGGDFVLAAGESVANLTVFGGNVVLEAGSTVTKQLVVFGGNVTVNGGIQDDITIIGGQLTLNDTAVVDGDVAIVGGNLSRAEGAQIEGSVTRSVGAPFGINVPEGPVVTVPRYWVDVDPLVSQIAWFASQTLGITALAMLVILFAPKVTERAGDAALARPWAAVGLGLLVAVVTPPLLIGFAITVIGIPITLVLAVVVGIVLTFGWIALGFEVGKRLEQSFNRHLPVVVSTGLGTFLLALVANGIGQTPCVGWIVPALVGFVGMGGVILSRFGTQNYPTIPAAAPPATA